jgi:murein DD-endopeptidase MepM/ murein hydrolase activator NlpD
VRTLISASLVIAAVFAAATSAAAAGPDPSTATVSRIATVGELFGPAAASDAAYILYGDSPGQVWSAASGPETDGGHDATTPIGEGQVEMYPGHGQGLEGVPLQGGLAADPLTQKTIPGDAAATGRGAAACPVQGPVNFTDTWGAARPGALVHEGSDLFAAQGTPVVAIEGGVLVRVDRGDAAGSLGGRAVSYVTASGDRWYNAHFDSIPDGLSLGAYIPAGTVIGFVGTSGNAKGTPPHLHIEWHPAGGEAQPNYAQLRSLCG